MHPAQRSVKPYRLDILVIAALILISLSTLAVFHLTRTPGAYARVELNGTVVGEYPLSLDGVYPLNGGSNVLTIREGTAYMTYSDCPDHVCENAGKVSYVGQTIVCLPNRLSVTVVGSSDGSVDFVS